MWVSPIFGVLLTLAGPALAAEPAYLGAWHIAEARPAPWVKSAAETFPEEERRLVGQTVTYGPARIEGPSPLACDGPRYELLDVPPEGLFQGGLTAPAEQATALGFRSRTIETLQTGCEGWIDFHFVDATTALFALNNAIYTLRRR